MIKLFKNRIFIGVVCLLLAGIIAFGLLPGLYSRQASTAEIVRLDQTVEAGTVITDDMLTVAEVGAYGLPDDVVRVKSQITGLVAESAIYCRGIPVACRFAALEDYQADKKAGDFGLSDGTYLLTINLPSESSGLAGILRAGDAVDVYSYSDEAGASVASVALTGVSVYQVLNSKLVSLDDLDVKLGADPDTDESDYDFAPAYVVFIVNEQQARVLIGLEKDEALHLTLRETEVRP